MKMINRMYWINIVFALACAAFDSWIQGTIFLAIANVFYAAELTIKELKNATN